MRSTRKPLLAVLSLSTKKKIYKKKKRIGILQSRLLLFTHFIISLDDYTNNGHTLPVAADHNYKDAHNYR